MTPRYLWFCLRSVQLDTPPRVTRLDECPLHYEPSQNNGASYYPAIEKGRLFGTLNYFHDKLRESILQSWFTQFGLKVKYEFQQRLICQASLCGEQLWQLYISTHVAYEYIHRELARLVFKRKVCCRNNSASMKRFDWFPEITTQCQKNISM